MTLLDDLVQDSTTALLVIDQQIDFEPGGALAVEGGDEISLPIAHLMKKFPFVVVTQDSHPSDHISFASSYRGKKPFDLLTISEVENDEVNGIYSKATMIKYLKNIPGQQQVLWPDHCVVGSTGWFLDPRLPLERACLLLRKGTRKDCDSYSAFFENDGTTTGLAEFLRARSIKRVVTVGLAGDYCVYWSAKDAKREGFEVIYDPALTRYVNFPKNSKDQAIEDLLAKDVKIVSLCQA